MGRKILLADDSVTIRKVVELTLMEEDYELVAVADGRAALEKLEELSPDLVIADVHMGEVGGLEVCDESKNRHPGVPVLLLVGTFEPFDPEDVESHGADAFLKKPFDSQDLLNEVERLLRDASDTSEASHSAPDMAPETPVVEAIHQAETGSVTDEEAEESTPLAVSDSEPASPAEAAPGGLSDADVDRIARRVVELLSDDVLRNVAWEVVPDMAEIVVKDRLRDLESQVE